MTAKEYLSQARHLDSRINSKIQMLDSLNDLAKRCTSTLSMTPVTSSHNTSKLESTVAKIIDLENEINAEIDKLVDLKAEIKKVLSQVADPTQALILEKRYLCNMKWEDIAREIYYDERQVLRVHGSALNEVQKLMPDVSKCH